MTVTHEPGARHEAESPNRPPETGPPAAPPPGGHTARRVLVAALALLLAVVAGGVGSAAWRILRPGSPPTTPAPPAPTGAPDAADVARAVSPSVVNINAALAYRNAESAGTGIVLTSDGLVLTNNHVIEGSLRVRATSVTTGRTYAATVVGYSADADIAVIRLAGASGLPTAPLGDSAALTLGESVVALGNAGGTGGPPSVTTGNVTALDVDITATNETTHTSRTLTGLIETDARIESGDSGGPLVDTSGRVVGVVTAASDSYQLGSGGARGYAIPIDTARAVADQIRAGAAG